MQPPRRPITRSCSSANTAPLFREPFLIEGVCSQISVRLRIGAAEQLPTPGRGRVKVEGDASRPQTAWPMVGPALLAHATSSLRSIVFRLRP
jgi:hypothetical protein